jgi:hypothetical protein
MKRLLLLFQLIAYVSFAQESFISLKNTNLTVSSQINAFTKRPTVGTASLVDVNFAQLTKNQLSINLFGDTFGIEGAIAEVRGINNYTWSGKDFRGQMSVFTVLDEDISGFFYNNNKIYRLVTIDKQYLMYEVKQSAFPSESCHLEQLIDKKIKKARENNVDLTTYDCKVRVLFFYTNAALNVLNGASMLNFAQSCIDVANLCYQNSNIAARVEMAYVKSTAYVENPANMFTSLDDFTTNSDGKMDEVHDLRTKYSADVCVLLGSYTSSCGIAYLSSDYNFAFSVDDLSCAVDNLTFPHEIGHNFGSYHDPYVTSGNPLAYGYGYINLANRWRTVMAYNNQCADNGYFCDRIPYFSNPNVNYLGNPTGTIANNDNARVHNERTNEMKALQQPNAIISLTSSDAAGLYGYAIATDKVENTSTFSISAGNKYTFNAAKNVQLNPGFVAANGSVFMADIAPIVPCGVLASSNGLVFESQDLNAPKILIKNNVFHLDKPNKTYNAEWLDVRGEKIEMSTISDKKLVNQIKEQSYFVRLLADSQSFIYQIKK